MELNDEPQPDDRQAKRPSPPAPLSYQRPGDEPPYRPRTPVALQVTGGFVAWLTGLGFVVQVARSSVGRSVGMSGQEEVLAAIGAALVGVGTLAIWLRLRFRWRGFLPGLLIGFGLTCLVPVGLLLIICGGMGRL